MSCYHPKAAWMNKYDHGGRPIFTRPIGIDKNPEKWREITIPCGKCIGCRLDYSKEWATRITMEMKLYPENYFLTLTYDNLHVPWGETINEETGELITNQTLRSNDLTKFMKDLRRHYEYYTNWKGIRFFACGEYGSKTQRPHYHIAMLNMPITPEEKKKIGNNQQGDVLFQVERISKIWGKGFVTIGELNWQSAAYVARYITKKQIGKEADLWYKSQGIQKEFVRMSRNPGIGMPAIIGQTDKIEKIIKEDKVRVAKKRGTLDNKVPKFVNQAYRILEPEQMWLKEQERAIKAQRANELKRANTTLSEKEQREIEERNQEEKARKLIRNIEI